MKEGNLNKKNGLFLSTTGALLGNNAPDFDIRPPPTLRLSWPFWLRGHIKAASTARSYQKRVHPPSIHPSPSS